MVSPQTKVSPQKGKLIMKYFSEKLNKTFDDVESLEKAEKDFEEAEKKKAVEVDEKAKTRKELAKKVEEAELSVSSAYDKLEQVKKECAKILDESNKQVSDMLDAAYDIIKKAEEAKCEAINKYNEECGTYTKYYTGRKAVEEFNKAIRQFDTFFNRMFRW